MTRDERRASIVEATAPLLEQYGHQLTTKQIAEAAGVAEGTIFRVFDSLQEVIEATVTASLSPERLEAIVADTTFPGTLVGDVEGAFEAANRYFDVVRSAFLIGHNSPSHDPNARCARDLLQERDAQLTALLTACFAPYTDELTVTPSECAQLVLALAIGERRRHAAGANPLSREVLVGTIVHGVRKPA